MPDLNVKTKKNLEAALGYALVGWSVIPVRPDKRPLVPWKEYQHKRADDQQIRTWWAQYPDAQIGIVTGAISNLTVVDVESDGDPGVVGMDVTMTASTGGGGWHFYFLYDNDFTNAVRLLPSVDVRSEGGYVVAPPSETQKGAYKLLNALSPIQVPPTVKKALLGDSRTSQSDATATKDVFLEPGTVVHASKRADYSPEAIVYQGCGEGGRNDSMTKYIGMVLTRIHPSLWDVVAWPLAVNANRKNTPPLPDNELASIFQSISNRERTQNPSGREFSRKQSDASAERITEPSGGMDEDVYKKPAEVLHAADAADRQTVDTDVAFGVGMPPFDDALLGGFSPGDLVIVSGKPGVGKTTLIQDWSVTLALGNPDHDGPRQDILPALWFSYEVLVRPLWKKFEAIGASRETPIYLPSYNESSGVEWVEKMADEGISKYGVKVLAVDHLGFLSAPRGTDYANHADAITHTVRYLKQMAVRKGLIIFLPAHVKKTHGTRSLDLDDLKDSSGLAQEADSVFFIDRLREEGEVTEKAKIWMSKNRKTGNIASGVFEYRFGRYWYNDDTTKKEREKESNDAEAARLVAEFDAMDQKAKK